MAENLRLPRVPKVAVIRELLHQLETDTHTRQTVTTALQERHRKEP
ncbi:hypothetical protein [Kocuria palustris]|nr:hypothetical protein [Kocuria palustris]